MIQAWPGQPVQQDMAWPGQPVQAPQQAAAAPSAPSRPAPVSRPQQMAAPTGGQMTDLGISQDEEITALVRQGYSMDQARQMASEPETAGSDLIARYYEQNPDAAPGARLGTPEEGIGGRYDPSLGAIIAPTPAPGIADNPGQGQQDPSRGYLQAMLQERLKQSEAEAMGLPGTFGQDVTTMASPFNDELAGAVGYLSQGLGNIGRRLTGRPIEVSAADRGAAMMDLMQEYQQDYQRRRPLQAGVAQAIGGAAFAPARAMGPLAFAQPTFRQALGQAAATGGVYGFGDTNGSLANRAVGGAVGAGAGATLTGLIGGGEQAVRALTRPASERIGRAFERTLQADQMTPQDFVSRLDALPQGGLPMDVAGPNFQGVVEAAAQMPGRARTQIQNAIQTRQAGRADRLGERVSEGLGGTGDYIATLDNAIQTRRNEADRVIGEIGGQQYRPSENAIRSLRSRQAQEALATQAELRVNSPNPATREEGIRLQAAIRSLGQDINPNIALDIRTAQDASRALLDASSEAWRNGNGGLGKLLGDLGKSIRDDARQTVGAYDQWLTRYGDESEQIGALELGRQIFRNADDAAVDGLSAAALRTRLAEMSETSQDMFRKGVGEAIIARARASGGDIGAMRNILRSREIADRVRLAFPDEASMSRFFQSLDQEVNAANLDNQILGNSRTAFRTAAQRQFGAEPPPEQAANMIGSSLSGLTIEGLRQAAKGIGRTVARNRSLLENPQSNDLLGRALTDRDVLRALLTAPSRPRGLFGARLGAPLGTLPQTAF